MNGKIKAIEGIYPITTLDAVKVCDGTSKSLKDMIDNGEIGSSGTAETNVNFITNAYFLVDDLIFTKDPATLSITINLNKKLGLNRVIAVSYSNGSYTQLSFPDGTEVPSGKSLIWNSADGFQIVDYNSIKITYNALLVATNFDGRITGGLCSHIWDKYHTYHNKQKFDNVHYVKMDEVARQTNRTLHSMITCGDELITLECNNGVDFKGDWHVYSLPDLTYKSSFKTNLVGKRKDEQFEGKINLRLVTADYNNSTECLIFGSGTSDGSDKDNLEGYIFYDTKSWKDREDVIAFDNTIHTVLDFHTDGLFAGQTTAKIVWAELGDMCYLTTSDFTYVHKIRLGVGTQKLTHGNYDYSSDKRYNGTYEVVRTFSQEKPELGTKDNQFYKGNFYYSVKYTSGGFRVYKSHITLNGDIKTTDCLVYEPLDSNGNHAITGSPEGIVVWNDKIIASHATYGKFYVHDVL